MLLAGISKSLNGTMSTYQEKPSTTRAIEVSTCRQCICHVSNVQRSISTGFWSTLPGISRRMLNGCDTDALGTCARVTVGVVTASWVWFRWYDHSGSILIWIETNAVVTDSWGAVGVGAAFGDLSGLYEASMRGLGSCGVDAVSIFEVYIDRCRNVAYFGQF